MEMVMKTAFENKNRNRYTRMGMGGNRNQKPISADL